MNITADVRAIMSGPFSVPVVFGASVTRGHLVNRPLRVDDGFGGETTIEADTLRVMAVDVPGITRGNAITVDGSVRQVRDVLQNRDAVSVSVVLA